MRGRRTERAALDRLLAEVRAGQSRGLTAAELAGGFGLPSMRPLASRIEQSFQRQLQSLPVKTQRPLLAAAAEPIGEVTLLWRAAERLGCTRCSPSSASAQAGSSGTAWPDPG